MTDVPAGHFLKGDGTLVKLTPDQDAALAHVIERTEKDGSHSLTGCPRGFRAMCRFGDVLRQMEKDKVLG